MHEVTRSRWAAVGAAIAVTLGAGGVSLAQAALGNGDRPVYVALDAPCRLADTRPASQIGSRGTPIGPGDTNTYTIQVTGGSGECTGGLAVPADATAVALNVTAIAPDAPSGRTYLTVHPADTDRPGTSNLNVTSGAPPTPNKVDVGLSADGRITIYNHDGTAHAAVDVFGYYTHHHHDDRYYTKSQVDAARRVALPLSPHSMLWAGEQADTLANGCPIRPSAATASTGVILFSVPVGSTVHELEVSVADINPADTYAVAWSARSLAPGGGLLPNQEIATASGGAGTAGVSTVRLAPGEPLTVANGTTFRLELDEPVDTSGSGSQGLCSVTVHYTEPG